MRCHQYRPEAYYRRRKPFLPHTRRRRCRSSSNHTHTRTGRDKFLSSGSSSLKDYSTMSPSLSSLTPSSSWTDDISLTRVAMLNRRTLRRSVSSDGSFDGEEVFDRWMSSSHATTGVSTTRTGCTSSAVGGSVSNLDGSDSSDGEPPSYAFINAHQPKRQVSDDPEEIQRLVESLRRQGSL